MGIEFYFGLFGLFAIPLIAWLISSDRSVIMFKTVLGGLFIQLLLGAIVLLTRPGQVFFRAMNNLVLTLLGFSDMGAEFLFGRLVEYEFAGANFAFSVLPTIIFFSSLMSVLYYTGFMQKMVEFIAWIMVKILGTSGAETLSVSANIFVGQTEAPLVVRPFIKDMTLSELNTVMAGGFATVAGGVMAAYVGMLHPHFPAIAGHLITASIMSAPAALVMSKLTLPETEKPATRGKVDIEVEEGHQNIIDAAASGAASGLKLALNVGAMLLAFIAIVYMVNHFISWAGGQLHLFASELDAYTAFIRGAGAGVAVGVFLIARGLWRGKTTKSWMLGLCFMTLSPLTGYYFLPVIAEWFGASDPLLWESIGVNGGFFLGAFFVYLGFRNLRKIWAVSVFLFILGGAAGGFAGVLPAVIGPEPGAAALSFGLVGLCIAVALFWARPDLKRTFMGAGIILFAGSAGALLARYAGLSVISILPQITLQNILGLLFSGLALLVGTPLSDLLAVGQLIGEKVAVNEFVSFLTLQSMAEQGILTARSLVIASYVLCGVANFSSIAIQIGGIGGIAPERSRDLAKLGLRAMTAGVLASAQTAAVAGVMYAVAEKAGIQLVTLL